MDGLHLLNTLVSVFCVVSNFSLLQIQSYSENSFYISLANYIGFIHRLNLRSEMSRSKSIKF